MTEMKSGTRSKRLLEKLKGDFKVLAGIVGIDNALKISATFGGLAIHIPKLDVIQREKRDSLIRQDYDEGTPIRKIAMKYGLTQRRVYSILKGSDDEE